jgi:hypothetical protein
MAAIDREFNLVKADTPGSRNYRDSDFNRVERFDP